MKYIRKKYIHETAQVAAAPALEPAAPALDKFEVRKRAARIFEAHRGDDHPLTHDAIIAELRAWARGEGVELDDRTIEEATHGMGA